jgi:hypothetical protein
MSVFPGSGIEFGVQANADRLARVMREAEQIVSRAAARIGGMKVEVPVSVPLERIQKDVREIEGTVRRMDEGFGRLFTRIVSIGTAFEIARRAARGFEVAADVGDALRAIQSGDFASAEAAKAEARKSITATVPGSLAQSANRLGLQSLLDQLAQQDPGGIAAGMVAARQSAMGATGAMSDEQVKAAAEEEARTERRIADRDREAKQVEKILAVTRRITDEEERQLSLLGKTAAERQVIEKQRELALFNETFGDNVPAKAKAAVDAARAAQEAGIRRAEGEVAGDFATDAGRAALRRAEDEQRAAEEAERSAATAAGFAGDTGKATVRKAEEDRRVEAEVRSELFAARQTDLRAGGQFMRAEFEAINERAARELEKTESPELRAAIETRQASELRAMLGDMEGRTPGGEAIAGASRTFFGRDQKDEAADVLRTLIAAKLDNLTKETRRSRGATFQ